MESLLYYSAITGDFDIDMETVLYLTSLDRIEKKVFDINQYSQTDCLQYFRFDHEDIQALEQLLQIPDTIVTQSGKTCPRTEGLCIMLRRLVYPNRYCDISNIFDRTDPELSEIFNTMISHVYRQFGIKLTSLNQPWLDVAHLEQYSAAISAKGSPVERCWGFIDGTIRPMCRPKYHQRSVFNGHKRVHALKYQSIVTPNGLIAHLYGPEPGRRHDAFLLNESGIMPRLAELKNNQNQQFCLYGDPAYPIRPYLLKPFRGTQLTDEQKNFNKSMSSVRESVEWQFGKVLSLFAFVDFKKNQKLFKQPLAMYYAVCVLLTNCHTCIYGSITSQYFKVTPPTLQEYLAL